jgi:hypothetical protein
LQGQEEFEERKVRKEEASQLRQLVLLEEEQVVQL